MPRVVAATETFPVAVVVNQDPVLAPIGDQSTIAQQTLNLTFTATDDGPAPLTITQTNTLPNAPTFTDNGGGTASFAWTPNAGRQRFVHGDRDGHRRRRQDRHRDLQHCGNGQ